jgi:hypothetical protein
VTKTRTKRLTQSSQYGDQSVGLNKCSFRNQTNSEPSNRTQTRPHHNQANLANKIEANRRNALRSTGPKTQRGKLTVSRNAIKHGLLARQAVITRGEGAESPEENAELLAAFHEHYQPAGISEELLVQRIAICYWRLARVLRVEVGETRKRLDNVSVSHTLQKLDEASHNVVLLQLFEIGRLYEADPSGQKLSMKERYDKIQQLQSALTTNPIGIAYLRNVLAAVKLEIQETGGLSKGSLDGLMSKIGFCNIFLFSACVSLLRSRGRDENGDECKLSDAQNSSAQREHVISMLDERLASLEQLGQSAMHNLSLELDAEVRSLALPDEGATDKVLRYETHLDRQLYRAMDQLERLQRRRGGESVPPPVNVNWGGHAVFAKQSH